MSRVLVIEDNQANLDLITYLLEAYGYGVSAARDGRSGLEAARRERPDLIISDIQMPGMDGFEIVERLKRDPELRAIKAVAMTAYAMVGDREKLLAAGFDGYISKPIRPESFIGELSAYIAEPAGTNRAAAAAAAVSPEDVPAGPARGTVLLVDDTGANAQLVRTLLEPSGFEVRVARTLAEGERLALARTPQLILCDVHIGKESGYDLIGRIKAHATLEAVPFVFLTSTAWSVAEDARRARSLGACDFIQRPIDGHAFIARIEACVQGGKAWQPS